MFQYLDDKTPERPLYKRMTTEQKRYFRSAKLCAICSNNYRLCVDHDHSSGLVRDVLCDRCNQWLGVFESKREYKGRKKKLRKMFRKMQKKNINPMDYLGYLLKWNGYVSQTTMQVIRLFDFSTPKPFQPKQEYL